MWRSITISKFLVNDGWCNTDDSKSVIFSTQGISHKTHLWSSKRISFLSVQWWDGTISVIFKGLRKYLVLKHSQGINWSPKLFHIQIRCLSKLNTFYIQISSLCNELLKVVIFLWHLWETHQKNQKISKNIKKRNPPKKLKKISKNTKNTENTKKQQKHQNHKKTIIDPTENPTCRL